jgi:hypothetical protein
MPESREVPILWGRLVELRDCLNEVYEFLCLRDQMNARLHLSDPRYSPLTTRVTENYRTLDAQVELLRGRPESDTPPQTLDQRDCLQRGEHDAHLWKMGDIGLPLFCSGEGIAPKLTDLRCSNLKAHQPHQWVRNADRLAYWCHGEAL